MVITSAASTMAHNARNAVLWKVVAGMAFGIIVGAYAATQIASRVNPVYIALFFAIFMAFVAIQMFIDWRPSPSKNPITQLTLVGVGVGIGSVSALAAVGGGFLTIMYLTYKNIEIRKAIGTSAAIGFPISIAGAAGYMVGGWSETLNIPYAVGYVYLPAFIMISVASVIAVPFGARMSHNLPATHLKKIFAVVSLLLSVKMLLSVI